LLEIQNLTLTSGARTIVRDLSLSVDEGRVLGLIGGSGSGKSLTALTTLGLLPPGIHRSGEVRLRGEVLTHKTEEELCAIRGRDIGIVFQEPLTALNPVMTIGDQVAEVITQHRRVSRAEAAALADRVLTEVELPAAQFPRNRFPHELSGGQRQRVAIAIAIALQPRVLIADEPTTALDVTTQAQVLNLLKRLVRESGMSLIFISHDLPVVAAIADEVAILDNGEWVDGGDTLEVLSASRHPRTRALVRAAAPLLKADTTGVEGAAPVLEARGVSHEYPLPRPVFWRPRRYRRAVSDVSFSLYGGETLAIVGESGSGKSTLVRRVLALEPSRGGAVLIRSQLFPAPGRTEQRRLRRHIQAVFQDPYGSFDPRWNVGDIVAEPLALLDTPPDTRERLKRARQALVAVGLDPAAVAKLPHEFSGGERQRIALARALVVEPDIIALDEATSALDTYAKQQILELFTELARRRRTAFLFVSHDLATVRNLADRVMVMKDGEVVESGDTQSVFAAPQHPYTAALLAASRDLDQVIAERRQSRVQQPELRTA